MPEIEVNGISLSYDDTGHGPAVILVHGNVASARWWQKVTPLLSDRFRVIVPDLRGFGRSEKPGTGYAIAQYAADLEAMADALGLAGLGGSLAGGPVGGGVGGPGSRARGAHWVGHSLGGSVILQVALDRPDLVHSLTLIDPGPAEGLQTPADRIPLLVATAQNRDWMKMALAGIAATAPKDDYFEALVDDGMAAGGVLVPNALDLNQWNVQARLGEIRVPTLIVMGEKDPLVPLDAVKRTATGITGSRLEVIQGVTHSPPIESPDALLHLMVPFLDTVS